MTFCFALLAVRQLWVQVVAAPALRLNAFNSRTHLDSTDRGRIVARDGSTVLARSNGSKRVYPLGVELAQTVGYVSQRYGESGLEAEYDQTLDSPDESESLMKRLQELFDHHSHHPPRNGGLIVTTIDPHMEDVLYHELAAYPRAAGVVLNPHSGEVLAIASVPSFDPNTVDDNFNALVHDTQSSLLNRAVNGLYPPGSTFKIVTAATGLETSVITTDSTFNDPGFLPVGSYSVHDDEGEATGRQDLAGAFALSSNVDFAQIGLSLGVQRFYAGMQRFGLENPISSDIPISRDRVPSQDEASQSILAQLSFGQAGLLVTPMRMALIDAAVANGGIEPKPIFVRSAVSPDNDEHHPLGGILAQPFSTTTAATLSHMMRAVVTYGTGTAANSRLVDIAGKTGTATNPSGPPHAWFVAFAPVQRPTLAIAVIVENAGYGGTVAAPIARRVITSALSR